MSRILKTGKFRCHNCMDFLKNGLMGVWNFAFPPNLSVANANTMSVQVRDKLDHWFCGDEYKR